MNARWTGAALALGLALGGLVPEASAQNRPARVDLTRPSDGYTYYNRAGATIEDHDAAVRACAARAAGLNQMVDNVIMPGLVAQGLAAAQDGARFQANIENCMVVGGWRVVRLPDGIGQRLFRMKPEDLSPQLATVVGVQTPELGQIIRVFGNEAARGDTIWGAMPAYYGEDSLSLRSVDLENLPAAEPALVPLHPDRQTPRPGPAIPVIQLTADNVADLPPETALVIIRVVGTGRTNGEGLGIGRVGFRALPPVERRVESDPVEGFYAGVRWTLFRGSDRERRESLIAIPVVPGAYRIESRMNTMEYCLGAPVTEVKAGEVVFLGTFDIAGPVMGPDLSLAPAEAFLVNDPARRARLRPAAWRNGNQSPCGLVYFYALEIPGAPFEPGYVGGSAAAVPAAE